MQDFGKYKLIRKIATGGMAEVFLATADGPSGFQKELVVKRILPHFVDNPQFVQMFLSEAKLASRLNHPNIVHVFDSGQFDRDYFIAMEFVDGMNLRALNAFYRYQKGPIGPLLCARIVSLACEGLSYAHAFKDPITQEPLKLVHRDISPDNLMVSRHGSVKVLDFGIAKAERQEHRTRTGVLKGKMAYMAKEQLLREPLDHRVDIYALGMVLYELLTGELPFSSTNEVSIIQAVMSPEPLPSVNHRDPSIPPQMTQIVAKAISKSRDDRYANCAEFQADLERYIQDTGVSCLPSDLAQLVEVATIAYQSGALSDRNPMGEPRAPIPAEALAPTLQTPVKGPLLAGGTPLQFPPNKPRPNPGKPSRGPLFLAGTLAIAAAALASYVLLGNHPQTELPTVRPSLPAAVDAAVAMETVDAGTVLAVDVTDAGQNPVEDADEVDGGNSGLTAGTDKPIRKHRGEVLKKGFGEVEIRVRPYAVLYVDGKRIGQTPLEDPINLSVGTHQFRMVNERYQKDLSVEFVVKPGRSVFKFNLLD